MPVGEQDGGKLTLVILLEEISSLETMQLLAQKGEIGVEDF